MNDLPAEVYHNIFQRLSRPDINACSFVCRQLNVVAVQVYGKELIINDNKIRMAKFNLKNDTSSECFKNGHLVRKLVFKSESEGVMEVFQGTLEASAKKKGMPPSFSRREFLSLLEYLPNIEEINLTGSGNYTYYISILRDANLRHIKKITALPFESPYCFSTGYQEYFFTCFKFYNTLTSLYFQYTTEIRDYNYSNSITLDMLRQFNNLKQLVFYSSYSPPSIMFRIHEVCPQLTELTFTGGRNHLQEFIKPNVKLYKKLQRLNIILPLLLIDFTKYLTSYIEDGLSTVNIQVTHSGLYTWIEDIGIENALELMKNLGQLNDVYIFFMDCNRHLGGFTYNELKTAKWFQVVNAFKGNKKSLCTVKFWKPGFIQDYFRYNSLDSQLILGHGLYGIGYTREQEEPYIYRLRYPIFQFGLPSRSFSTIGPEIIDRIELKLDKQVHRIIRAFLKYAFTYCLNLQVLKVENYLQIQDHPNQRNNESNDIQNNLKMARFLCGAPTGDMLNIISYYLQNIEILVFGSRGTNKSILDLILFKNLKRSYFCIQDVSEHLSIRFEYPDGIGQSYYFEDGVLVREDTNDTIYGCRSFTFICERDVDFIVYFGYNKSYLDFDIDTLRGNYYRIPHWPHLK